MASGKSNWVQRNLLYRTPLFKKGPICGNYHKRWDRYCHCCVGEHFIGWNGGVYSFQTEQEATNGD